MIDLDLRLEAVQGHVNHCVTFTIEYLGIRKLLEIEPWIERDINRKWPMGNQMVTRPMTSRDLQRSNL